MSSATSPQLGGMKFMVEKVLHSDDHGAVVLIGDQSNLGKHYALKKIKREDEAADFYLERAKAAWSACQEQKLSSPVFVQYFDYRTRKKWFKVVEAELLMEYINGKPLSELGKVQVGQGILVFKQLATALATMYRRKVMHGDLRSSNVMITKSGQVKLLNYGVAAVQPAFPKYSVGVSEYMAPEQIKQKTINEKTDLYQFGALMYHVLTGRVANSGTRQLGEGGKISTPSALNSSIPVNLNNLIVTCLQSDPDKRPDSFSDVFNQLEGMANHMHLDEDQLKKLLTPRE